MSTEYVIRRAVTAPDFSSWNAFSRQPAEEVVLASFRVESSGHHPEIRCRLLYNERELVGMFHVADQYVRCVRKGYNESVCRDSCVEFFVQPFARTPYFNFEMNCGGAMLCSYIEDAARTPQGFAKFTVLPAEELQAVRRYPSLPARIDPEITAPTEWTLGFAIPFALMEKYCGPISPAALSGSRWRGNFYKCADETSHPHWASWQPVSTLNFHLPECFGSLKFE